MLMLLSPAKSLIEGPAVADHPGTQPVLIDQMKILHRTARARSATELRELMSISDKLATLNQERFQQMSFPHTPGNARQAALTFNGDVYRGLDASSLSADDLAWAQDHVVILSGLYGVLRPLDLMQPYRLEMGTKLETRRGKTLYDYWGDRIAKQLRSWLREQGDDIVVNLASNEYFKSVDTKTLGARVITPVFQDVKDGKARVLAFFAKQARGAMVRWAITERASGPEALKACDVMGYRFDESASKGDRWVYRRQQPPPVNP